MCIKDKPIYRAKIVRNYTDKDGVERSHWTDVGGLWPHKDGKGFDVALIALPIDGRLVIRHEEPKPVTGVDSIPTVSEA
jgi:hypothetical protein